MAVEASPSNMQQLNERLKQQQKKEAAMLAEINQVIAKLKEGAVKVGAKVGTSGKIFGSVTSVQISRAIRDQKGYEIDRRKIHIIDEIKELGNFKAKVDFGHGHETELELEVVAE
jgi:large subunit ribosomal protein L9